MLTVLNNYAHGYAAIPVILACKKQGLFKALNSSCPVPFKDLAKELQANSGHLRAALHMLESLNWVSRNDEDEYALTAESDIHVKIPENIMKLMSFPMNDYLNKRQKRHKLGKWMELSRKGWNLANSMIADYLDGMLVVPLLLALKENNLLKSLGNRKELLFSEINPAASEEIIEFFIHKGWLAKEEGTALFTDKGLYILEGICMLVEVASYKPILCNISEVIFGDCKSSVLEQEVFNYELRLGATLHKMESEFRYKEYYSDMEEIILSIFNRVPFEEQPKYIASMECGDGILLKKIYEAIKNKSLRGKVIKEYPVKLIAMDSDEKALEETAAILEGIEHVVLKGDIGDPEQMVANLRNTGISDVENILYIHSFFYHPRPYVSSADTSAENPRPNISSTAVYVDGEGSAIPSSFVMQNLVERLKQWSAVIGKHGLIALEAHCLEPKTVSRFIDKCESLHFDACHRFSHQLLVEADMFLLAAAETGLFPNQNFFKKYPKMLPFSQITLNCFEQREYRVRYAQEKDLPALEQLEKRCWEPELQRPVSVLEKRIQQYPKGQLVLEIDNQVVGSIYSQRIDSAEDIKSFSFETVEGLHRKDGPVVQLLTVNVLPELQHKNLGDQLLEFMLQLCTLMNGVHTIVAVTKCKDYHKHTYTTPAEYINLRNENGRLVDTVLRFHELHGAQIKELVPNYRPQDKKNEGYGVLVEYDVYNRQRNDIQVDGKCPEKTANTITTGKARTVQEFVVQKIAAILGKTAQEEFSLEQPLMEMGLDSADLLDLNEQICCEYQIAIEPTFFFKYNTAARIIAYLQEHVDLEDHEDIVQIQETVVPQRSDYGDGGKRNETENVAYNSSSQRKEIAIIGTACRLPGGIVNKEQLWSLLAEGEDAISKMPLQRWNWPDNIDVDNKHKGIDVGGFLDEIATFDASFFRISPKEAELMDPQQRILLELSWECLEEAGYSAKAVSGGKVGVFIGASGSDYNRLLDRRPEEIDAHYGIGTSMAILPNRISYFYDFHGPSILIDTACSSSLVAVHEAVKSLQAGECEQAFVGGINVMCHPFNSIAYYKAGMLSKDGRCKTFDKEANGYVRGEGAVMMLLKPLEKALCDRDNILAVIKGTAINHGGQASGLTVPNPDRQAALLMEAYRTADIQPETISYIEAHGTGTSLGDPIEISGIKEAFSLLSKAEGKIQEHYCGIGSIKTNIGHLEAAAGIAGLLKVAMSMQHQMLPASLNFNELNPHISLEKTPFYIVNKSKSWKLPEGQILRRAGVSSFGSGGANAHVVLEEAPVTGRTSNPRFPYHIICLSAKTEEELQKKEQDLALWLEKKGPQTNLADISVTLLFGREHFEVKAAYVVSDIPELQRKLNEVMEKGQADGYFRENSPGKGKRLQPLFEELGKTVLKELNAGGEIDEQEYSDKLMALAELYVKGYALNWKDMYTESKMPRISLPTYPFTREHYWVPDSRSKYAGAIAAGPAQGTACERAGEVQFVEWKAQSKNPSIQRKICLLKKQWEVYSATPNGKLNRTIAILATQETMQLAIRLSKHFNRSRILDINDIASKPEKSEEWSSYAGCVDLVGCGKEKNESLNWIAWLQQLIECGQREGLMILCVTKGLESFQNSVVNLSGASRVELYRMLQTEYSHLRSRHMDVELSMEDEVLVRKIASELLMDNEDSEICYRNEKRYRAYLQEDQEEEGKNETLVFPEDHVLLITGGTRGLGYLCAQHFITNYGVKRLVLTGREALPPKDQWDSYTQKNTSAAQKIRAIQALENQGVRVQVLSVSLTDKRAVEQSLEEIKRIMGPIGGIIHCAGLSDSENPAFIRKSLDGIQRVLNPKVAGLDILYQTLKNEPLRFFVLFSSVAAIIPTLASGQSDYAMANAYMDYVAEANMHVCPIVSIQWPSWKETGMGEIRSKAYRQTGLLSLTNAEGLRLLDHILSRKIGPIVLPAVVNQDVWKPYQLMQRTIKEDPSIGVQARNPMGTNSLKGSGTLMNATQAWLISLFSRELRMNPSKLKTDTSFQDYGIDSILLAQLLSPIRQLVKEDLDPSILLEYSTIESLAAWLESNYASSLSEALEVYGSEQSESPVREEVSSLPSAFSPRQEGKQELQRQCHHCNEAKPSDIAVIGLSCRFPGAGTLEQYWQLLSEGRSAIYSVPRERWGYSSGFYAGLLHNITHFDPSFFLIPEEDAKAMDPQAFAVLEESLKVWYHAGYSHQEIKGKPIGVYLGARSRYRPDESSLRQARNPIVTVGQNYLAANISQFFDLRGPSVVVDTACSSALVGMNMAVQALHSKEIASALVGGVCLLNTDEYHQIFQQRKLLSEEPSFHIFDKRASGVVLGEGVGMVLLKTVEQALADGDQIYAVIKAVAINNDGRTAGPATPSLQAQKAVMQAALDKSGKRAEDISYIEVNGSGSEVTDLLELKAIHSVYRSSTTSPLGLGSVKPNIGHPLCAEGIASFIKVVLMLQHQQFVPFLSAEQAMAHYDMEASAFCFCRKPTHWSYTPSIAAINCFADGGTNAHVILEAWKEPSTREIRRKPLPPPELKPYDVRYGEVIKPLAPLPNQSNRSASNSGQQDFLPDEPQQTSYNTVSIWKRKIVEV